MCYVEDAPPGLPRNPATIKYKWRFHSQSGKLDHVANVFIEALKRVNSLGHLPVN